MIVVVDASIAVKWFVEERHRAAALDLMTSGAALHAPDWIMSEVAHALFRKWQAGELPAEQARFAVNSLPQYFDQLHHAPPLMPRAFDLALELSHAVYDCLYLACAEIADGTVVTADRKFIHSTQGTSHTDNVRYLEDMSFG